MQELPSCSIHCSTLRCMAVYSKTTNLFHHHASVTSCEVWESRLNNVDLQTYHSLTLNDDTISPLQYQFFFYDQKLIIFHVPLDIPNSGDVVRTSMSVSGMHHDLLQTMVEHNKASSTCEVCIVPSRPLYLGTFASECPLQNKQTKTCCICGSAAQQEG